MLQKFDQPIIAIATAPGRGAVGIVRLSAKSLRPFIFSLLGRDLNAREATYLAIRDFQQEIIDHGIAIYFESPNSYTGEDVLELQVHGGAIILDLIISRCFEVARVKTDDSTGHRLENLRMAQAGEFTQRAFLNDKMDLAQAEAVADLIDATTEAAAKSASRALSGVFSKQIEELTHAIVRLRMLVEATLDFPEEEIDFLEKANAKTRLDAIIERIQTLQKQSQQGALLQNGMSVVIAGQPNAGKSSLLNALAGAELAIVTPIAGTTRDKVAQTIQIKGVPIHVIDTAGLREGLDEVEKIGIKRSWLAIEKADAVIFLHDLSRQGELAYQEGDAEIRQVLSSVLTTKTPVLDCWNKLDTSGQTAPNIDKNVVKTREDAIYLSAKTGVGLDVLREKLLMIAGWQPDGGCIFSARKRHVEAILDAKSHLILASRYLNQKAENLDLLAEELRLAQDCLSQITGEFTPDDLLGVIFKEFCIGK